MFSGATKGGSIKMSFTDTSCVTPVAGGELSNMFMLGLVLGRSSVMAVSTGVRCQAAAYDTLRNDTSNG